MPEGSAHDFCELFWGFADQSEDAVPRECFIMKHPGVS